MTPQLAGRLAVLAVAVAAPAWAQTPLYPGQTGAELRASIRAGYTPTLTLDYGPARDSLYAYAQRADGQVCGVYSGFCIQLTPGADPSTSAFDQGVNAEHSWPQSRGAQNDPARADLHILFPARADVNSGRSNFPYAEIPDAETDTWFRLDQAQSAVPTENLDEWSERQEAYPGTAYRGRFEPRESVKGAVARAAAYFAAVWEPAVGLFGERDFLRVQLAALQAWHAEDPATDAERARSAYVAGLQGAENPFVLDPTLLDRAFTDGYQGDDSGTGGPNDAAVWVNELHYDNVQGDRGEFVEIAGPAGTDLDGWRIVLHSGNGGEAYSDRALSGIIPDEGAGFGAVAFQYPANGLQNGAPDGLVLVDDNGDVVQALSYEGQMVFVGGPADGLTSQDIGVQESNAETAAGQSLRLTGTGDSYADFAWAGPSAESPGTLNPGQSIGVGTPTEPAPTAGSFVVSVYPNPARDHVSIRLPLGAPATVEVEVEVVDVLGRVILRATPPYSAGGLSVRLDGLAPGAYVLSATDGRARWSVPFSVSR